MIVDSANAYISTTLDEYAHEVFFNYTLKRE